MRNTSEPPRLSGTADRKAADRKAADRKAADRKPADRQAEDAILAAATIIRRGATSFAARARAERGGVLTLNQTAVLGQLAKNGAMTPTEIADRLHSSLQSLTRTLAGLEDQRMLSRATDPDDRRQSMLSITTTGREELWNEMRPRDLWIASVLGNELSEVEIEILVAASKLLERLSEVDSAVAPIER